MKKLLLILTVVCVSVTSWAGADDWKQLNPYAYGLSSSYDPNTQILTISFTLNAPAIIDDTYNTTHGVQVYATDGINDYLLHEVSTSDCQTEGKKTYKIDLSDRKGDTAPCDILPFNTPLTWKVVVWGNKSRTIPKVIYTQVSNNRPNATHGVAIDKNPESPKFGNIYYTEASSADLSATWDWMEKYTRPCIWQYTPKLTYQGHFYKDKENNVDVSNFVTSSQVEPHRIRISDDNRIFVSSCYTDATTAVWEYKGGNNFNKVITRTDSYGRVLGMDVFGSGNNLKILLCYMSGSTLRFREYALGSAGSTSGSTDKGIYTNSDLVLSTSRVGVSYDDTGDTFWFGIDNGKTDNYGVPTWSSRVIHMTKVNSTWQAAHTEKVNNISGGDGIFVKGDLLVKGYYNQESAGQLKFYTINKNGTLSAKYSNLSESSLAIWSSYWVNDMDMDYAGNLYVASAYAGNAIAIAMPYDGKRTTPAPAGQTFTLADPVPNILATDLCVTPHDKQAKYIFSFNVNTKPEGAEIRFYTSEQDMLNDSKQNATYSDYDNHDKCAYYYRFSPTELKQGRMSVELDILGHEGGKELSDKKLPAGKLYWNVYLKTRESLAFAPIYVQPNTGEHLHYRIASTIDNNPDNDGFGHIYAIDTKRVDGTTSAMKENPCALMVYTIGDANIDDSNSNGVNSATRYSLVQKLSADDMVQPRRPTVAPDGMVYLTDYGDYRYEDVDFNSTGKGPNEFVLGGIWLFNPNDPYKDAGKTAAKLSRFHPEDETVSDACFYHDGTNLKLYKTNTYDEYDHHAVGKVDKNYQDAHWTNNGYRVYTMRYDQDGSIIHQMALDEGILVPFKVKDKNGDWVGGDANGSLSVRATSDGVWFCQNRKGDASTAIKPDNIETVALMFYNHDKERKFQSYTYDGGSLTQYTTSLLQSTPGAGMTISPDEKYLYVVNHEGNILEFEIGGSASTGKTLTYRNKYINTTTYKCIVTLDFDYAGNLVATTDENYPAYLNESTQIVVFTMPYSRNNARTIPASKAQREIPERLSYAEDEENTLATIAKTPTLVDLFRPMPNTSYSTICLPFALDISTLEDGHPYKTADIRAFKGAELSDAVGGEKILYLNFSTDPVTSLSANTPYIIQPSVRIPNLVQLPATHWSTDAAPSGPYAFGNNNSITFTGVIPKQDIVVQEGKTLLLVAENRLAEMAPDKTVEGQPVGEILGFRGYFTLGAPLPKGMQAVLRNKDNTVTGLVDINGKKVNINKYLREGRVYIRVGDSSYTVDGQLVK